MINLLPDEVKNKRKYNFYRKFSLLIILGVVMVLFVLNLYNYNTLGKYQKRVLVCKEKLEQINPLISEIKSFDEKEEIIKEKEELISNLEVGFNCGAMIKDLNIAIPYQVWLTDFIILKENKFRIIAQTCTNQKIIETVSQLNQYPLFTDVKLECTEELPSAIRFDIRGNIKL